MPLFGNTGIANKRVFVIISNYEYEQLLSKYPHEKFYRLGKNGT